MATSTASTAPSQAVAATSNPASGQPAPSPNEMLIAVRVSNWKWGLGSSPQLNHVIGKTNAGLVGLTADNEALLYVVTTDHDAACSLAEELEGRPAPGGGPMMRTSISTAACYLRGKDALHDEAPTGSDGQPLRYSTSHYDAQKYPLLIERERQVQASFVRPPLPLAFAAPAPTPRSEPKQAAHEDPEGLVACAGCNSASLTDTGAANDAT